ncbi:hypothetical protein L596_001963 [Steinernema carpocapsae]|uniref:Uncharacterized protein n=1 Tax=Steinernema carpocapsae TaxID=34508 RepID=A0A4U8UN97_STECR|nr:hypothetical protein L596_001963 [Steinernema carpocapsae]
MVSETFPTGCFASGNVSHGFCRSLKRFLESVASAECFSAGIKAVVWAKPTPEASSITPTEARRAEHVMQTSVMASC